VSGRVGCAVPRAGAERGRRRAGSGPSRGASGGNPVENRGATGVEILSAASEPRAAVLLRGDGAGLARCESRAGGLVAFVLGSLGCAWGRVFLEKLK